jgi:uncharacterized protein (DUF2062 family)
MKQLLRIFGPVVAGLLIGSVAAQFSQDVVVCFIAGFSGAAGFQARKSLRSWALISKPTRGAW